MGGAQITSCAADYKADIVRQLLPRCDDKCEPMKQCKSSCKALKSKCVPSSLQVYFPMVKKGGSMRSMLPMIGLSEGAPELKVIDAWLEKLDKCDSEYVTNAKVCLSADYAGAACNPSVTPTPTPITPTPTPITPTPTPITPTPITPTPITPTPSSTDCKQITADGKTY